MQTFSHTKIKIILNWTDNVNYNFTLLLWDESIDSVDIDIDVDIDSVDFLITQTFFTGPTMAILFKALFMNEYLTNLCIW